MSTNEVPSREQLVRRASELVPVLRANAAWSEENRRLHEETLQAMTDAGIFKLRAPRHYGGYEAGTRTMLEVAFELGRGDGSAAWVSSVYWILGWMACSFPDEVQDEIFANPDARVCGTLSPSAMAHPADGGVVVNGKWAFMSGAHHAHWQEIMAILVPPEGEPYPIMALVPSTDLLIVDDWHTSGLRGTGSVSVVAQDLFIPQERILSLPAVLQGHNASKRNLDLPIYRPPLVPVGSASLVGTAVGLALGAKELFLKRLSDRKITYTSYENQREATVTHLQLAEATIKVDEAQFHARRLADLVDAKSEEGAPWKLEERARVRADVGAAVQLAKEAVDVLVTASGGSSIYSDVPIQRVSRDIQAVSLHALMNPTTNAELYGRVLCGLEPNTLYI